MAQFLIDARTCEGAVRLRLHGELDLAAVPALAAAIDEAVRSPATLAVSVDMREVTFLDCAALGELIRGRELARRRSLRYRVVEARGLPLQIMEITGVLPALGGEESR